jgi:hypothetical protein
MQCCGGRAAGGLEARAPTLTPASPSPPQQSILSYALRVTQRLIINRNFRHQVRAAAPPRPRLAPPSLTPCAARRAARCPPPPKSPAPAPTQPPPPHPLPPKVLRLLVRLAEATPSPDWVEVTQCLMFLDDAPRVADILGRLVDGSEDDVLVAYQVGRRGRRVLEGPGS